MEDRIRNKMEDQMETGGGGGGRICRASGLRLSCWQLVGNAGTAH